MCSDYVLGHDQDSICCPMPRQHIYDRPSCARRVLLGAHNSIAGGIHKAVARAQEVGGEVVQIFCKNQRQFDAKPLTPEDVRLFKDAVASAGLGPVMVHGAYLINMGSPDPERQEVSYQSFKLELQRCEALGVDSLNIHPGSHVHPDKRMRDDPRVRREALARIASSIDRALEDVAGEVQIVLENSAGQGTSVGSAWQELGVLADAVARQDRVGVCVDTQHAWAAGHDWRQDYDSTWDRFDDHVGLGRLVAFHLNDSKQPLGARVDRHDNIPHGHLGHGFWTTLMQDPRFDRLPGYLETPLVDNDTRTWAQELEYLKALRDGREPRVPTRTVKRTA